MNGNGIMVKWCWKSVFVLYLSTLAAALPAHGQAPMNGAADSDWRVSGNTWLWAFGITGDIGVGTVTTDVDASFSDVVDASDSIFAFSGRVELGKGRIAGFVDGTYADVEIEDASGPLGLASIDVVTEIAMVDFGLMYRLGEWVTDHDGRQGTLDIYGGGRYFDLEIEIDPANAPSRSGGKDWVDPIVGLKLHQPISDKLALNLWGDVGGFGVESDMTWSATGVFGYDCHIFSMPATVYAGYRAIAWDYTEGSGASRFEWDVVLHGPTLGLRLLF